MKKIFKLWGNVFKGHENLKYGATELKNYISKVMVITYSNNDNFFQLFPKTFYFISLNFYGAGYWLPNG